MSTFSKSLAPSIGQLSRVTTFTRLIYDFMRTSELTISQRKWIGENSTITLTKIRNHFIKYHHRKISLCVIKRWRAEGAKNQPNYTDKPRSGRPKVTDGAIRKEAKRLATQGNTAGDITNILHDRKGVEVSISTTRRILGSGRKPLTWALVQPKRQLSQINKNLRIDFCAKHLHAHTSKWVFIDAKFLYVYQYPKGKLRFAWQNLRYKGASKLSAKPGGPWVYLFYGAVGLNFKSDLYFVPPSPPIGTNAKRNKVNFKSEHFIEMLGKMYKEIQKVYPNRGFKMLWDHARQHDSKMSKAAVQDIQHNILQSYPPQSWDINIIENCWGMLDLQLLKSRAKCSADWYRRIRAAWGRVQQGSINKLVDGVIDRLELIVESNGEWVPHH
jgi:hypothetical protein